MTDLAFEAWRGSPAVARAMRAIDARSDRGADFGAILDDLVELAFAAGRLAAVKEEEARLMRLAGVRGLS